MDNAVAQVQVLPAVGRGHGFHGMGQGTRCYAIGGEARRQVLARLLALNHGRYAEEARAGLHKKKKSETAAKKPKAVQEQGDLFD